MSKAEENYKYALNKDKYDSEVVEAVDKKSLKKKDANTVNKIQEMMRKEKEEQKKKSKDSFGLKQMSSEALKAKFRNGELEAVSDVTRDGAQEVRNPKTGKKYTIRVTNPNRDIVTSENRDEYMAKKLKLANKQEPVYKEE
jgi:methionine salvage enolase-phosphatase E1